MFPSVSFSVPNTHSHFRTSPHATLTLEISTVPYTKIRLLIVYSLTTTQVIARVIRLEVQTSYTRG
jgi:hypothetical protein